jgi:alpha-N-arabinofuranosidase
MFLRTPREQWYDLKRKTGFLAMQLRPEACAGNGNPSFLGRRQQHATGSVSTSLDFDPQSENEKAGLLVFQNEQHFYFLCKSLENNEPVIQLFKSADDKNAENQMERITSQKIDLDQRDNNLYLKIEAHGSVYSFLYASQPDKWMLLQDNIDATFLSTRVAGGFVGCIYALYATSLGESSQNTAYFDWFEYQGNDEVYR